MVRRALRYSVLMLATAFSASSALSQTAPKPVTSDDVISMTQVGLSDQIIVAKIKAHNKPMDLTTDELVAMKRAK
jgi:hypothetical protein